MSRRHPRAMSTFSPVGSWSSNGMRISVCVVCGGGWGRGRNELDVCTTLAYSHIRLFRTTLVLYTSKRTHPFSNYLRMRTDGAKSGYCPAESVLHCMEWCTYPLYLARGKGRTSENSDVPDSTANKWNSVALHLSHTHARKAVPLWQTRGQNRLFGKDVTLLYRYKIRRRLVYIHKTHCRQKEGEGGKR